MKTFLTTAKGKIVAGISTVAVVGGVIAAVLISNSGYRTIAVEALNGITKIVNGSKESEAYVGQHLKSGDDVTVTSDSDLTLALDTDKYVYAPENTHFTLEATGKKGDTRTKIYLDAGSNLCRIDNKLAESESFQVDTPNATMSVRGTIFKVSVFDEVNGDKYTVVDVLEGEVFVQVKFESGDYTEQSRLIKAGDEAVIRSNKDYSEFVDPDDPKYKKAEENHRNKKAYAIKKTKKEVKTLKLSYLTQGEARFLGRAIDDGRNISITKELLYDMVDIIDHEYVISSTDSSIAICSICGDEISSSDIPSKSGSGAGSEDGKTIAESTVTPTPDVTPTPTATPDADSGDGNSNSKSSDNRENKGNNGNKANAGDKKAAAITPNLLAEQAALLELLASMPVNAVTPTPAPVISSSEEHHGYPPSAESDSQDEGSSGCSHSYVRKAGTYRVASCTDGGYEELECSICGDVVINTPPATGHRFGGWEEKPDAAGGYGHARYCQNAGCPEMETGSCTPSAIAVPDGSEHYYQCTEGPHRATNNEPHTYASPTPADGDPCTVCGQPKPVG